MLREISLAKSQELMALVARLPEEAGFDEVERAIANALPGVTNRRLKRGIARVSALAAVLDSVRGALATGALSPEALALPLPSVLRSEIEGLLEGIRVECADEGEVSALSRYLQSACQADDWYGTLGCEACRAFFAATFGHLETLDALDRWAALGLEEGDYRVFEQRCTDLPFELEGEPDGNRWGELHINGHRYHMVARKWPFDYELTAIERADGGAFQTPSDLPIKSEEHRTVHLSGRGPSRRLLRWRESAGVSRSIR